VPPKAKQTRERESRSPLLEVSVNASTFVASCIDGESQLDFKLMEKPDVSIYSQEDFKLIEEAFYNLEAIVPQNQKRSRSSG